MGRNDKRLDDLERAVNPPGPETIRVCVDWGDTVKYQGKTYTKAEWEAVKADLGFDDLTTIIVDYVDRAEDDQDDLTGLYQ